MDSFAVLLYPFQSLANPPSCITAIYAKNKAGIEKRCLLQIRNTNSANIPTSIAPNVWILTSALTVVSTGIMIICPEEAPRFIKTQTAIPHLSSTTSMQCLHLNIFTTLWKKTWADYQHISQHSEPPHDKYLISRIQNMATSRGPLEQDPASPLC